MKRPKTIWKQLWALTLVLAMLGTSLGQPAFTVYAAETENGGENTEDGQSAETPDPEVKCICTELCSEEAVREDCPVCAAEGADLSDCKGKGWGRHQFFEQVRFDTVCCKYSCSNAGKQVALDAAVISNRNGWVFILLFYIVCHALCCQRNCINIHAVGSDTQHAAQTSGAKLQHLDKTFFDLLVVALDLLHFRNEIQVFQLFGLPDIIAIEIVHGASSFLFNADPSALTTVPQNYTK